jgi:diaminohydroxyphosphoribosylaminopyrimidine deaminase/5-amino-6-(5-phosphoribosylamino)uracil reductase
MQSFSTTDERMMRRALELAAQGIYSTPPNPRVGCVIARGETIVGEGWHRRTGEAHAEPLALQSAGDKAKGATAYVTLEPHCHHSRTPPCTDALIRAGISRVVTAVLDPNPKVSGAGQQQLSAAGIDASAGLLESEARELNAGFFKRMTQGMPWVTVKIASSLDGRVALANGESRWITSEAARHDVQRLRARSSAIVTGINTVLADDPQLTVRSDDFDRGGRDQPLRVVLDSLGRTPAHAKLLSQAGSTLLYTSPGAKLAAMRGKVEVVRVAADGAGKVDLRAVLRDLGQRECNEILIEAGPILSGEFLRQDLADEVIVYLAPVLLGDGAQSMLRLPALSDMKQRRQLQLIESRPIGPDVYLRLRPVQH